MSSQTLNKLGIIKYGESDQRFKESFKNFNDFEECSLTECFQKFKIVHELTSTAECLREATILVIKDFFEDNVIYLELRTTPRCTESLTKKNYLQTVIEGIRQASEYYPTIIVKLLPSIDRSQGLAAAEETLALVLENLEEDDDSKDIIKGIDFSGNPKCGSFADYKEVLTKARNAGLKLALHCGEVANPEEIKEMLEFGMDRCGHGTFITGDNLKFMRNKQIPLEICLSSNVACGTVKDFKEHHFKRLFGNLPLCICVSLNIISRYVIPNFTDL